MVNHVNENEYGHVLTIEDPIEFLHESKKCLINQREVGPHTLSFANALRSALREDPDYILVGEMRDLETIRLALTAAETGHLVFGTLHTSSAAKTIDRIIDVFPAAEKEMVRAMLSESLVAVISQTLMKTKDGQGRMAAHEIMIGTPAIRNLIREGKVAQMYSSIQTSQSVGMQTLDQCLVELVRRNLVNIAEARNRAVQQGTVRRLTAASSTRNAEAERHAWNANAPPSSSTSSSTCWSSRRARTCSSPSGFPPAIKVDGKISPVSKSQLSPQHTIELVRSVMNDKQAAEFEGSKECNFAISPPGIGRFRVNAFVQQGRVGMVLRTINTDIPKFEELGLPPVLRDVIMSKRGIMLFVGATGSGKSTSMAALLGYRNENSHGHIITIEDPIEFVHEHRNCIVTQREVGVDTDGWQIALKNTLRQAPDVILIGEVRERETMDYAISFAETGHLCLATLHANSTNQALDRIINFFPEERRAQLLMDLSLNVRAFVAQRLIPRRDGRGRVPAVEVMLNSPLISDLIFKGDVSGIKDLMKKSRELGMQTFDQSLFDLYEAGLISYEDALRNADSLNDLRLEIKLHGKEAKNRNIFAGTGNLDLVPDAQPTPAGSGSSDHASASASVGVRRRRHRAAACVAWRVGGRHRMPRALAGACVAAVIRSARWRSLVACVARFGGGRHPRGRDAGARRRSDGRTARGSRTARCPSQRLIARALQQRRATIGHAELRSRAASHRDQAAPDLARARDRVLRRSRVQASVRVPARLFAVGRSPRPRSGPGSAAGRQARRDDQGRRGGRPLRDPAHVLRRSRHRHLFVGLPARARRGPGRAVAALSRAARDGRVRAAIQDEREPLMPHVAWLALGTIFAMPASRRSLPAMQGPRSAWSRSPWCSTSFTSWRSGTRKSAARPNDRTDDLQRRDRLTPRSA